MISPSPGFEPSIYSSLEMSTRAASASDLDKHDEPKLSGPENTRSSHSFRRFSSLKVWFRHNILLSGARYIKLNTHPDEHPAVLLIPGWRSACLISCTLVGICLLFNITFTAYLVVMFPPNRDGIGDFGVRSCDSALSATSGIHVGINILATVLVAASNYNMQCLTAPSRREIDRAHQKGSWLDIGIHSVHNLRYIPRWKLALWFSLLISSLPLHLLWNSAVFSTSVSNSYAAIVVSQNFLETRDIYGGLSCANVEEYQLNNEESYAICWTLQQARVNNLKRISTEDCMRHYSKKLENGGFNLIAVVKDNPSSTSSYFPPAKASIPVLAYFDSLSYSSDLATHCRDLCNDWCVPGRHCTSYCNAKVDVYGNAYDASKVSPSCYDFASNKSSWNPHALTSGSDWICNVDHVFEGGCTLQQALENSTEWTILPDNYEVDHCLTSESTFTSCKLQYSSVILYLVIACNAIKFVAILLHVQCTKRPILATLGDAVASFLRDPDITTRGKCLYTKNTTYVDGSGSLLHWKDSRGEHVRPLRWERTAEWRERWHHGASFKQLFFGMLLWLTCLALSIYYLVQSLARSGTHTLYSGGFGTMNLDALVSASSFEGGTVASILTTSLLVNLPQVLFSNLYFTYNAIYTSMASAYEWSRFARSRKGLRVTARVGRQKSSYWLQLPFKFSIPLLATSTVLHWLISQSMFLTNLTIIGPSNLPMSQGTDFLQAVSDHGSITVIGYSPRAILCSIVVGVVMLTGLLTVSQFHLTPGMPLVGSNSFAISAACHAPECDRDAATNLVMWGAVSHQQDDVPGHCCFSSYEVDRPRVGEFYAGK